MGINPDHDRFPVGMKKAAELIGVNPSTLRRWFAEKKISDVRRDRHNRRIFRLQDIQRIQRFVHASKWPNATARREEKPINTGPFQDEAWVLQHLDELRRMYDGSIIAVVDRKVVAHAETGTALRRRLARLHLPRSPFHLLRP